MLDKEKILSYLADQRSDIEELMSLTTDSKERETLKTELQTVTRLYRTLQFHSEKFAVSE